MTTVSAPGRLLADPLTGRKVRGDSKLDGLSAEQQATLRFWLEDENRTYAQVVALVRTQFGVSVGKSAVGVYYQRHILAEQRDEELEAAAVLAALPVEKFTPAKINRAWYLAWSLLVRPTPLIAAADRLLKVVYRVGQRDIARQRLALKAQRLALRQKFPARPLCPPQAIPSG